MDALSMDLYAFSQWIFIASLKSIPLIFIILILQRGFKKYFSATANHSLWLSLFISLTIPFGWNLSINKNPAELLFEPQIITSTTASPTAADNGALALRTTVITPSDISKDNHYPVQTIEYHHIAGFIWLAVFLMLVSITLWQLWRFNRIKRCTALANKQQNSILDGHKKTLGITHKIPLLYSSQVTSPLTLGLFKPVIILPANIEQKLTKNQLSHVLLHELTHIQRRDILWNWLAYWVTLLHWFNPLIWFAYKRMKGDMEMACDSRVLAHLTNEERSDYGLTLISVSQFPSGNHGFNRSLGILENHRELKNRLTMIKDYTTMNTKKMLAFGVLFSALTLTATAQPGQKQEVKGHISADSSITLQQFAVKAEQDLNTKILIGINSDSRIQANIGKSPISYEQLLTQLQINGFTAFKTKDYIQILSVRDARTLAPIAEEGKTYFNDEFITDYIKLEKACAETVLAAVRPLVPSYGFLSTYSDAKTLIIVDAFSNVKRVKSVIAAIEKNLDAPSKCSKSEVIAKS